MATYLYCLLTPPRAEDFPRELTGIAGIAVRPLVAAGRAGRAALEAWVATIDDPLLRTADGARTATFALAHNEVVEAAMATGRTPLPARFGQRFLDDAGCRADLAQRAATIRRALARVAGCVEMGVVIAQSAPRVDSDLERTPITVPGRHEPQAGRRYLEALRSRARDEEARSAVWESALAAVSASVRRLVQAEAKHRTPRGPWSISHLVPREAVDAYRATIESMETQSSARLVLSGPRAPYSFSDEGLEPLGGHDSGSLSNND